MKGHGNNTQKINKKESLQVISSNHFIIVYDLTVIKLVSRDEVDQDVDDENYIDCVL